MLNVRPHTLSARPAAKCRAVQKKIRHESVVRRTTAERLSDAAAAPDQSKQLPPDQDPILNREQLTEVAKYGRLLLKGYAKATSQEPVATTTSDTTMPEPVVVVPALMAAVGQRKRKAAVSVAVMPDGEVVLVCEHGPDAIEVDSDQSLQVPAADIGGGSFFGGIWDTISHLGGEKSKVHRNFAEAFTAILSDQKAKGKALQDTIKAAAKGRPINRVTCVGHGLGGAIATVAAYWCAKSAFPQAKVSCITFGAPRVGNPAFAAEFDSMLASATNLRLIHEMDPLPSVPKDPKDPKDPVQFKHTAAGGAVLLCQPSLYNFAKETHDPAAKASTGYEAQIRDRPKSTKDNFLIEDHAMDRYQSAVRSCLGKPLQPPKDTEEAAAEEDLAVRLYTELQESGSCAEDVDLMSEADLQECFLYAQVAAIAYDDQFTSLEAKFNSLKPWMKEDLWGQIIHAQRLEASGKLIGRIKTDTEAIVLLRDLGNNKAEAIVGFRGTETSTRSDAISDMATDANGFLLRLDTAEAIESVKPEEVDSNVRVHKGFAYSMEDLINPGSTTRKAWDMCRRPVAGREVGKVVPLQNVKKLDEVILELADLHGVKVERITCTGHSLGAALSTLSAYWFKVAADKRLQKLRDVRCINFGSPRVGNPKFVEVFNSLISKKFRFMHRSDPVTMVAFPLKPMFDYTHIDEPVLLCQPKVKAYGAPAGKKCPPVPGCPPEFSDKKAKAYWGYQAQRRNRPSTLFRPSNVGRDHGMSLYMQGMNAALNAMGVTKPDGSPRNPLPLDDNGNLLDKDGKVVVFDKSLP